MRHRAIKLGLVGVTALSAALPLLATQSAYADPAPSGKDIVAVGSDTLQYMLDFTADGDAYGDTGYNQLGNKNRLDSFDATVDFNARLAYGIGGGTGLGVSGATAGNCAPGTGGTAGTANLGAPQPDSPCVLNPSVVLRAGLQAVQNPNGSGAGFKALVQDIVAGHSGANEVINFSRASSGQSTTATLPGGENLDQLQVATDTLPLVVFSAKTTVAVGSNGINVNTFTGTGTLNVASTQGFTSTGSLTVATSGGNATLAYTGLTATTFTGVNDTSATNGTLATGGNVAESSHAVPLSPTQLNIIYSANTGSCVTWSDVRISGVEMNAITTVSGSSTVTEPVPAPPSGPVTAANIGGVVTGPGIPTGDTVAASPAPTATSFTLTTPVGTGGTGQVTVTNPGASTDAIIPVIPQSGSGTRTFFLSQLSPANPTVGTCAVVSEENDPEAISSQSNPLDAVSPIAGGRLDLFQGVNNTGVSAGIGGYMLDPSCAYLVGTAACGTGSVSAGTYVPNFVAPAVTPLTGTPLGIAGSAASFNPTRPLFVYFRNSDKASTIPFQSPGTENWLNTLLYDPCPAGAMNCVTFGGNQYGPSGPPFIDQTAGQTVFQDAGVTPTIPSVCTDITTSTAC